MPDPIGPNKHIKRRRGGQIGNQNARRYSRSVPLQANPALKPTPPELIAGFNLPDLASPLDVQIFEQMDALRLLLAVLKQNMQGTISVGLLMKYTRLIESLTLSLARLARLRQKGLPRLRPDNIPQGASQAVITELRHYAETR